MEEAGGVCLDTMGGKFDLSSRASANHQFMVAPNSVSAALSELGRIMFPCSSMSVMHDQHHFQGVSWLLPLLSWPASWRCICDGAAA